MKASKSSIDKRMENKAPRQPGPSMHNLLNFEAMHESVWFKKFDEIANTLSQGLLLVAVLHFADMIKEKESTLMKKFLLLQTDTKSKEIVKSFLRTKSLYMLRSEIRGRMGLPRM